MWMQRAFYRRRPPGFLLASTRSSVRMTAPHTCPAAFLATGTTVVPTGVIITGAEPGVDALSIWTPWPEEVGVCFFLHTQYPIPASMAMAPTDAPAIGPPLELESSSLLISQPTSVLAHLLLPQSYA